MEPRVSTHNIPYVYATPYRAIALLFAVNHEGDFDRDIRIVDEKIVVTERRENSLNKYNTDGYLYTFDGSNFKWLDGLWHAEVVSNKEERVLSCEYIPNVMEGLEKYVQAKEIEIYRYPNKPSFIPNDDSDLVKKYLDYEINGRTRSLEQLVAYMPHLKEQVDLLLKKPERLYCITKLDNLPTSIVAYDNFYNAMFNNNEQIIIPDENGELSVYDKDEKFYFEKGGFNLEEDFYLYEIKGDVERMDMSSFSVTNPQIISKKKLNLEDYIDKS